MPPTASPERAAPVTEWVFRYAGNCLIDLPDLPVPSIGRPWRWVATLWPDSLAAHGWGTQIWEPAPRGFACPDNLAMGDVIEFGITASTDAESHVAAVTRRWYGWLDRVTHRALIVYGPFSSAQAAFDAGRPTADLVRMGELTGPTVDLDAADDELLPRWHD